MTGEDDKKKRKGNECACRQLLSGLFPCFYFFHEVRYILLVFFSVRLYVFLSRMVRWAFAHTSICLPSLPPSLPLSNSAFPFFTSSIRPSFPHPFSIIRPSCT
jgi:hypothetical protein